MKSSIIITLTIIFALIPSLVNAKSQSQKNQEWRKEMLDFKIKYLSKEMELRDDQEKQFTSLYSKMMEEKHEVMRKIHKAESQLKKISNPTEEDYKVATDAISKAKDEDTAIEKKYELQFKTFLSQKQLFKMKEAERNFRNKLMRMRHRKKSGPHSNLTQPIIKTSAV